MDLNLPALVCVALITVVFVIPSWMWIEFSERKARRERDAAVKAGRHQPVTIQPFIDLGTCMGSGACVTACPENVLKILDGQAVAINMSACVGHGVCVPACPVDAVELVFGSKDRGIDIPEVQGNFETNVKGLFVAGELGGMGLIANAADQGVRALEYAAEGIKSKPGRHDIVVVGAGPAGIAAALAAKAKGLDYLLLEQDELGGAVLHFPRKKLVFTRPMDLPLYGKVKLTSMLKEQLVELFQDVTAKTGLQVSAQERVDAIEKLPDAGFRLTTTKRKVEAQRVVLALGRRGTPRTLGAPGEDSEKVAYSLLDPELYQYDHVLVVGGGDSAVEAACTLGEQPGNKVSLSYRGKKINRPKKKNVERLRKAVRDGQVELILESKVVEIGEDRVVLTQQGEQIVVPNDYLFVFVGGILPTDFLKKAGVRIRKHFGKHIEELEEDPADEPEPPPPPSPSELGGGLSSLSVGPARGSRPQGNEDATVALAEEIVEAALRSPGGDAPRPRAAGSEDATVALADDVVAAALRPPDPSSRAAPPAAPKAPPAAQAPPVPKAPGAPPPAAAESSGRRGDLPARPRAAPPRGRSGPAHTVPLDLSASPSPSEDKGRALPDDSTRPAPGAPPSTLGQDPGMASSLALPEPPPPGLDPAGGNDDNFTVPGKVVAAHGGGQIDRIAFGKLPPPRMVEHTDQVMPTADILAHMQEVMDDAAPARVGDANLKVGAPPPRPSSRPDGPPSRGRDAQIQLLAVLDGAMTRNAFAEVLERVAGQSSPDPRVSRDLAMFEGRAHLGLGAWSAAIGPLERAVAASRSLSAPEALGESLLNLGKAYFRAGRFDRAQPVLEEALGAAEDRAAVQRLLADLALRRGDVDGAEGQWKQALSAARASGSSDAEARAHRGLAHCMAIRGNLKSSMDLLSRADEMLVRGGDLRVRAGVLCRALELDNAMGRYGSSLYRMEVLLELVTNNELAAHRLDAVALLAETTTRVGFHDDAVDAARQAVQLARMAPNGSIDARLRAARALCDLGLPHEAQQALDAMASPPEGVIDDPVGQLAALKARALAATDPRRAQELASMAMARPTPLLAIRAARIRLDCAAALVAANQANAARSAVKRGLKIIQGTNAKGLKLELLMQFHLAVPDARVAEAAARTAQKLMEHMPDHAKTSFRQRAPVREVLQQVEGQ